MWYARELEGTKFKDLKVADRMLLIGNNSYFVDKRGITLTKIIAVDSNGCPRIINEDNHLFNYDAYVFLNLSNAIAYWEVLSEENDNENH